MAAVLTAKALENLKPGPVRREVPDGLLPGLYFVVQPSGKSSWAVRYRSGGKPRKLTLGAYPAISLKKARELAREAIGKVAEGSDPGAERKAAKASAAIPSNDLVEIVAAKFLAQYVRRNLKPSTIGEVDRILTKRIIPAWRGRRLPEIRRSDVHDLLDCVVEAGAPIRSLPGWFWRLADRWLLRSPAGLAGLLGNAQRLSSRAVGGKIGGRGQGSSLSHPRHNFKYPPRIFKFWLP
jgi:hypothetical protein